MLGKIDSPLINEFQNVEWGTYKLVELFNIVGTKSLDSNAVEFTEEGINFIGRTFENNGIQGKIQKRDFEPNEAFTITATVIGNYKYVKYQKEPYYCSQNINKLSPKEIITKWNDKIAYFFVANIQKFVSQYDNQQGGYKLEDIKNHCIKLPIKYNSIDFEFMEKFISEIEKYYISKLDNYLLVTELKDYSLTNEEKEFICNMDENFKNINLSLNNKLQRAEWSEYRMGDLFDKVKTNKLPYKAKELPNNPTGEYVLPCLTSSFMNQGLNYYIPKENATILKNVISIPSNSDDYRAYYQSLDFTVLSDAYAIKWKNNNDKITGNQYLFLVSCINKFTDLPIYSYKNKLGGWNVVKNKNILLPVKNGKIDFDFMEKVVMILKKIIIKDVVLYTENANKNLMKLKR